MRADSGVIIFCQTTNAERAKPFYRDVLGLKFEGEDPFALSFLAGSMILRVQKMRVAYSPLDWTRFGWTVYGYCFHRSRTWKKGRHFRT
jgi:catechol 2,3-dioxygenase-like lactoylglutathione lyase family enzyme